MRCYKFMLAAFLALGLVGCSAEPDPEAVTPPPKLEAVTPASDLSAAAATAAPKVEAPAPEPFPGRANMIPTITAVTEFCNRSGSLAYMSREGCRGALSRLSRNIAGNLYFESMEACRSFLQIRRMERNNIIEEHREWCRQSYENLHDRKGCYDAVPVFLDSFTEEGFCRNIPPKPAEPKVKQPVDIEAPYLYGYSEPGQKFDSPKTGNMPTVKKAAPAKKAVPAKQAPAQKAVSATPAPVAKAAPVPKPAPVAPVEPAPTPVVEPVVEPVPSPAPTPPAAAVPVPKEPVVAPAPVLPAPNLPSEAALPALTLPAPLLPVTEGSEAPVLPAPVIGHKDEIEALPPVPSIGRIAPELMPGVPPDTAVFDNTLTDESEAPQITQAPQGSPLELDAFGDVIPNFMPPPPPDPLEGLTQPLPLSGAPAGQSGS